MSTTNQAALHLKNETAASQSFIARSDGLFQCLQIGLHSGIVYSQELVSGGHHVDAVGLAFSTLLVHELVDRFIRRCGAVCK